MKLPAKIIVFLQKPSGNTHVGAECALPNVKYSGSNDIDAVAWYSNNSNRKTHPVGTKASNELGVYDMSGNVWELCSDWYGEYTASSQTNPTGPANGTFHVTRGGSWGSEAQRCRVSNRGTVRPENKHSGLGFRLVSEL